MQSPRLPSIFKSPKVRSFSFPLRYYDERKERIKNLKKGKKTKIKFKSNGYSRTNTGRSKRLLLVIIALVLITYLILK
tara:strand:+ start:2156 stop:2389 length:234 start_codon:yes stop_codon:yes gene_type:complete